MDIRGAVRCAVWSGLKMRCCIEWRGFAQGGACARACVCWGLGIPRCEKVVQVLKQMLIGTMAYCFGL